MGTEFSFREWTYFWLTLENWFWSACWGKLLWFLMLKKPCRRVLADALSWEPVHWSGLALRGCPPLPSIWLLALFLLVRSRSVFQAVTVVTASVAVSPCSFFAKPETVLAQSSWALCLFAVIRLGFYEFKYLDQVLKVVLFYTAIVDTLGCWGFSSGCIKCLMLECKILSLLTNIFFSLKKTWLSSTCHKWVRQPLIYWGSCIPLCGKGLRFKGSCLGHGSQIRTPIWFTVGQLYLFGCSSLDFWALQPEIWKIRICYPKAEKRSLLLT